MLNLRIYLATSAPTGALLPTDWRSSRTRCRTSKPEVATARDELGRGMNDGVFLLIRKATAQFSPNTTRQPQKTRDRALLVGACL